jgi:cytochrome c biogenesis protein CcmG, thiol:disulfide interchange protein DsbE
MTKILRLLPLLAVVAVALFMALALLREGAPPPAPARPAPALAAAASLRGKPHFVNFFASWCAPCAAEQAALADCAKAAKVPVIGVSYKDRREATAAFLTRHGNPYAALAFDPEGNVAIDWGATGVPETFAVGADGLIRARLAGPVTEDSCARILHPAVMP